MKQEFRERYYGKLTYDWQAEFNLTLPIYPAVYDALKVVRAEKISDIAEYLGTHTSTVGRVLGELQKVGLAKKVWITQGEDSEL